MADAMSIRPAPAWSVSRWFNADAPPTLESQRGRVVFLHAFQMLCPGCVQHAVPQSLKVAEAFARTDLAVVGLHTVFEHHAVMGPDALAVYLHENRIRYPVGVDAYDDGDWVYLGGGVWEDAYIASLPPNERHEVLTRYGRLQAESRGHR